MANSLTEFDEEEFIRDIHQEGYDEGFPNGISQGTRQKAEEAARDFFDNGVSVDIIAKSLKMTEEEVKELIRTI